MKLAAFVLAILAFGTCLALVSADYDQRWRPAPAEPDPCDLRDWHCEPLARVWPAVTSKSGYPLDRAVVP